MQTSTRMNKIVIEDYHHMTIMDENVNWMKLMNLLSTFFSPNRRILAKWYWSHILDQYTHKMNRTI
jgi:hypothetical protein